MRTTVNLDKSLLEEAERLTGIESRSQLLNAGLRSLVERAAARRLAALGGSSPDITPIPRRRDYTA